MERGRTMARMAIGLAALVAIAPGPAAASDETALQICQTPGLTFFERVDLLEGAGFGYIFPTAPPGAWEFVEHGLAVERTIAFVDSDSDPAQADYLDTQVEQARSGALFESVFDAHGDRLMAYQTMATGEGTTLLIWQFVGDGGDVTSSCVFVFHEDAAPPLNLVYWSGDPVSEAEIFDLDIGRLIRVEGDGELARHPLSPGDENLITRLTVQALAPAGGNAGVSAVVETELWVRPRYSFEQ